MSFISFSPFSLANVWISLCIVKDSSCKPESRSDFLRKFCNILLVWKVFLPKTAAATSLPKLSGRILNDTSASRSCAFSLWKDEETRNCNLWLGGWSALSNISMILAEAECCMNSSRNWLGWALYSEIEQHNNLIAKGTKPQICVIRRQSKELTFESNSWTKVWA